jgi:hydroxymethylpyrimidine kinase/phosphomethylpyrimidine kinase
MPYRHTGSTARPDVLACAGLDPSGGAGLIADVRVLTELGARPVGVVTALTIQNTTGVVEWHASDPEVVSHQLAFLLTDVEVKAVKIGMVGSLAIAKAIANALHLTNAPVIWDPVAGPTLGNVAYHDSFDDAVAALRPHLALITPNARELALLTRMPVTDLASAEAAGRVLAQKLDRRVPRRGQGARRGMPRSEALCRRSDRGSGASGAWRTCGDVTRCASRSPARPASSDRGSSRRCRRVVTKSSRSRAIRRARSSRACGSCKPSSRMPARGKTRSLAAMPWSISRASRSRASAGTRARSR